MDVCSRLHPPCRSVVWIPVLPLSIVAPMWCTDFLVRRTLVLGVWPVGALILFLGRAGRHLALPSSCPVRLNNHKRNLRMERLRSILLKLQHRPIQQTQHGTKHPLTRTPGLESMPRKRTAGKSQKCGNTKQQHLCPPFSPSKV